jgi:hypothetical protein
VPVPGRSWILGIARRTTCDMSVTVKILDRELVTAYGLKKGVGIRVSPRTNSFTFNKVFHWPPLPCLGLGGRAVKNRRGPAARPQPTGAESWRRSELTLAPRVLGALLLVSFQCFGPVPPDHRDDLCLRDFGPLGAKERTQV